MGKGSKRRPQMVSNEVMTANWKLAFNDSAPQHVCSHCRWSGDSNEILVRGVSSPYGLLCPKCLRGLYHTKLSFDSGKKIDFYHLCILRARLKLEVDGKKSKHNPSKEIREEIGSKTTNKKELLAELNKYIENIRPSTKKHE